MLESIDLEGLMAGNDEALVPMDPRLQWLVLKRRSGETKRASVSTTTDEIAVIARVSSLEAWQAMTEVRVGATLGNAASDGTRIVTGRIPLKRVEFIRSQPFVKSLKAARVLSPSLQQTVANLGAARPASGPYRSLYTAGSGVVVGIVDFGMAFAHRNFLTNGKTRLLGLWDQGSASATSSSPFGYGRLYSRAEINAALASPNPYATLGYAPDLAKPSHGTHVTDIAAGNGGGSHVPGVAPEADILFVQAAASDIDWSGAGVVGSSFGDSVQLLEAVQFIFDQAGKRPCVVNISLGTNGGPHDGTTLVEQGLDRLVEARAGRAVVIAASNSFADGIHAEGTVAAGSATDIAWRVTSPHREQEMEVWYAGSDRFAAELLAPGGKSVLLVEPGETRSLTKQGTVVALLANRLDDPNNHDNAVGVFLSGEMPGGVWTVRLHGRAVTGTGGYHAWIERDDATQSSFTTPAPRCDLGSISCGKLTVAVGSYDALVTGAPLSWFSSSGPTRDGRSKPDVSAPGHDVWAADSTSHTFDGVTRMSGTSMASPAVTGVVALMLGEAAAAKVSLKAADALAILTKTARHGPPSAPGWDTRYGFGRVSALEALKAVKALAKTKGTKKGGHK